MSRRSRVDLAWSALVTAAILLPLLLGPGYWLVGDMVFVPHQPWKPAWLGLDGSLPRAVPMDAIVSAATHVVPGSVVQRVLLVGGFLAGGLGIGRLAREHRWWARAAAITLLLWNPWVLERLLIGQWAILLGYLVLPWVALAARRLHDDPRTALGPAGLAVVVAAVCSPSSGVTAVGVLAVLGLTRQRAAWWRLGVAALGGNLPWLVPALTATNADVSGGAGVFEGFAARAESAAGLAPSLLSLGGIWKTSVVPAERTSAALVVLSCLLSVAAAAGVRRAVRDRDGEPVRWAMLGVGALLVAALPALPGGTEALSALAARVPGVALVRDSHRFLAPLGLVLAVGVAGAATAVGERVRAGREALWAVVALLVVAPPLLLPTLAWGATGDLQRSSYPSEWEDVAAILEEDPARTVVLPWAGSYRGYEWNHDRAVLDPAPRYLPGEVLVDDRVLLDDRTVQAEDPLLDDVRRALAVDDPAAALRGLGVRWVLLERGMLDVEVPDGEVRHDGRGLLLIDLAASGEVAAPAPREGGTVRVVLVLLVDALALLLTFAGIRSYFLLVSSTRE